MIRFTGFESIQPIRFAIVLVLPILLAGCGGGGGSDDNIVANLAPAADPDPTAGTSTSTTFSSIDPFLLPLQRINDGINQPGMVSGEPVTVACETGEAEVTWTDADPNDFSPNDTVTLDFDAGAVCTEGGNPVSGTAVLTVESVGTTSFGGLLDVDVGVNGETFSGPARVAFTTDASANPTEIRLLNTTDQPGITSNGTITITALDLEILFDGWGTGTFTMTVQSGGADPQVLAATTGGNAFEVSINPANPFVIDSAISSSIPSQFELTVRQSSGGVPNCVTQTRLAGGDPQNPGIEVALDEGCDGVVDSAQTILWSTLMGA